MLNDEKEAGIQTKWYTYVDKNSRPYKVMARGLDPTTDPRDIIVDLKDKNFKILSAVNILKILVKKDPNDELKSIKSHVELRLFMFTFDNSESIDKIYGIKTLGNQVVKIEAICTNPTRIVQNTW
ncbi:hypothetical protein EAI_08227 [Harpegnathos saltator]|uniref:Pre-C2HC domain-containing protein n=1 Tax=Harpegnathos saltator TaxID=610380 RepID=E2BZY5_HARSA|nr:hypothetical protein EAI_08227 [Harpegnathos saltator]